MHYAVLRVGTEPKSVTYHCSFAQHGLIEESNIENSMVSFVGILALSEEGFINYSRYITC